MRDDKGRPLAEEITVAGAALVDKIKDLVRQGNLRRLVVRRPNGKPVADISLTAGAGVAALLTLLVPVLAALAAIAALVAQFRVEIERDPGRAAEENGEGRHHSEG